MYKEKTIKEKTLTSYFVKKSKHPEHNKVFDAAIARHVTKDMRPINTCEMEGFVEMFDIIKPEYIVCTRKTMRTIIYSMYDKEVIKLKDLLNRDSHVALTTDAWTSVNNTSFITTTAHFINEEECVLHEFFYKLDHIKFVNYLDSIAKSLLFTYLGQGQPYI